MKTKLAVAIVLSLFLTITSSTHACYDHPSPIAIASVNPTDVFLTESVSFSSAGSSAPCGGWIIEYLWDFGDGLGEPSNLANPSYTYFWAGDFDAKLRVRCNHYWWSSWNYADTVTVTADANMPFIAESRPSYGGTIYALTSDDTYIYAGGYNPSEGTPYTVRKYLKSNMTFVEPNGESPSYGGKIQALTSDDTYVYAGGLNTNRVRRYRKIDMTYVDETPSLDYNCGITALSSDADYIYMGRGGCGSDRGPQKFSKEANMPRVAQGMVWNEPREEWETPLSDVFSLVSDADYVYAGAFPIGGGSRLMHKYDKSNMRAAVLGPNPADGYRFYAFALDNTYIYGGVLEVMFNSPVRKYFKSDLSFVEPNGESESYEGDIWALTSDDTHIYAGGNNGREDPPHTVRKYRKSDMIFVVESPSYGGIIRALTSDDTYIYAAGGNYPNYTVRKYLK